MKIVAQDRPVSGSRQRAERLRHAMLDLYMRLRQGFVPLTKGLLMNLDVRIPRSEILDDSATRYGF
jgi:hypothetical protein